MFLAGTLGVMSHFNYFSSLLVANLNYKSCPIKTGTIFYFWTTMQIIIMRNTPLFSTGEWLTMRTCLELD